MTIGVDIDEVLFPLVRHMCVFLNRKYDIHLEESQFKSYDFWENQAYRVEGVQATRKQAIDDFYEFIKTREFRAIQPYKDAGKSLVQLKHLDELVAITSRQNELMSHTRFKVDYYFPGLFSDIAFGNNYSKNNSPGISKKQLCASNNVYLLVEDNLTYAQEVSEIIPVILFRKPWNVQFNPATNNQIHSVETWDEAVHKAKLIYAQRR